MSMLVASDEGELMVHSDRLLLVKQREREPDPDNGVPSFAVLNWTLQSDGILYWLRSANGDHYPAARLELWDGPPRDVAGADELVQASVDIEAHLGEVRFTNDDGMGG